MESFDYRDSMTLTAESSSYFVAPSAYFDVQNVRPSDYLPIDNSVKVNLIRFGSLHPHYKYDDEPNGDEDRLIDYACGEFLAATRSPDLDYGFESGADRILEEFREDYKKYFLKFFTRLSAKTFDNPRRYAALLKAVGSLEYADDLEDLLVPVTAAGVHDDRYVQEAMLHLFESWATPASLKILQSIRMKSAWLESYRLKIIHHIKLAG